MTDNQSILKEKENIPMESSSLKEEDHFKVDQVTEDEDDEFFAAEEQKDKSELVSVITQLQDTLSIKEDVVVEDKPEQEQVGESEENHKEEQVDKETLMASSAPNSPKPKPLTNLQIITEQIRTSIDLPAGQNMADFVTPPTPGAAPSPPLTLGGIDEEVDDLAHHDAAKEHIETEKKSNEQQKKLPTGAIPLSNIDFTRVKPNVMRPREQEAYGKYI